MSFAEFYLKSLVNTAFRKGSFHAKSTHGTDKALTMTRQTIEDYYFMIILDCHFLIFTKHTLTFVLSYTIVTFSMNYLWQII